MLIIGLIGASTVAIWAEDTTFKGEPFPMGHEQFCVRPEEVRHGIYIKWHRGANIKAVEDSESLLEIIPAIKSFNGLKNDDE